MKKLIAIVIIAAVAAEVLGVPVIDPVWQWVDSTLIDPFINWLTGRVAPW
ncbi:hypothetical protein [Halostella salina]|nr:hypothetical protein [Halostella salina]